MYPFERFSETAKKVLTRAQEEAERSHHSYIGTEHLLLGLLRVEDGIAARALGALGVEIGGVRSGIESVAGISEKMIVRQIIPTDRLKKVIELAFEEARGSDAYVGTEHLLIGLLLEGEGIAAHVLRDLGASLDRVRAELGSLHEAGAPEGGKGLPSRSKEIRERMHEGVAGMREGTAGMSPRRGVAPLAGQALEAASRAAREQHTAVGPEHLLLALLDGDPLIRRMLVALGIDDAGIAEARRIATPPASLLELRRRWETRSADLGGSEAGLDVGPWPDPGARLAERRGFQWSYPAGYGTLHPSGPDRPASMAAEVGELARLRAELDEAERRWRAGEDRPEAALEGRKRPRRGRGRVPRSSGPGPDESAP